MKRRLLRTGSLLLVCVLLGTLCAVPAAGAAGRFRDVPAKSWAAASIDQAVDLGLFQGETKDRFGMGHKMTRAAFVVVLCRLFRWEPETPEQGSYRDNQDRKAWYFSAVETAYRHGAITAQTDTFRPRDPITREELAVMLVRALGYGTLAGMVQELPMPFTDVSSNAGYISVAYRLGIVSGTSKTTFSPTRTATREQAAVMLVRTYTHYYAAAPAICGAARIGGQQADNFRGYESVAAEGVRLNASGSLSALSGQTAEQAAALCRTIQASGAKALLLVSGTETALSAPAETAAASVASRVSEQAWDGAVLDLAKLPAARQAELTELVRALKKALGDKLLYVAAEAPAWRGTLYGGYDYAALGAAADRLILRTQTDSRLSGGTVTSAPLEPLEEVYYALGELQGAVPPEKITLWITTTGNAFSGVNRSGSVSAEEIRQLLDSGAARSYYSERYEAAYLVRTVNASQTVVWYHNARSAAARDTLASFFGVGSFFLSDLSSLADYPGGGSVRAGLLG